MRFQSLKDFIRYAHKGVAGCKALGVIFAEDDIGVQDTIAHLRKLGFDAIIVLAAPDLALTESDVHQVDLDILPRDALFDAVNHIIKALPNIWLHYCYNSEYLFYPFCETRNIHELIAFHESEGRRAFISYVVDLYAGRLDLHPNGVSRQDAHFDAAGYYAEPRKDPLRGYTLKERQMDFFGGLRWRYDEHIPWDKRRIDRISLFKTHKNLRLLSDYTLNDQEMNTYACPDHPNITTAITSFRTAKALRTNPGARALINDFRWQNSLLFQWNSRQLLDNGLIEPGQWF